MNVKGGKAVGESAGRDRGRRGQQGGGSSRRTAGLHWEGALLAGSGSAAPEEEAPGVKAGGGDRDFIPNLVVQSPYFE